VAEKTLQDLEENQGWRITWDEAGNQFVVECAHSRYRYEWPGTLQPGWRWGDHFKRMMAGDREACG
jgi:hypothetical protein